MMHDHAKRERPSKYTRCNHSMFWCSPAHTDISKKDIAKSVLASTVPTATLFTHIETIVVIGYKLPRLSLDVAPQGMVAYS